MLQIKNYPIKNKNIIKILLLIIVFSLIIIFSLYSKKINSRVDKYGLDQQFTINSGSTVNQISANLYNQKLIGSKFFFELYVWKKNWEEKIQAGEYILNPKLSIKEITEILVGGRSLSKEIDIKIIEGWNVNDIGKYFNENNIIDGDSFIRMAKKDKLEGYLFPDTYRIYKDSSLDDIVVKMLNNFDQKLTNEMRDDIKKQGKTVYEIITMASIIEKEVRTQEDMNIVSGIFWDRIKRGQALESCATLAYILGINKKQYTIEDTKIESPYNTYRNQGLPPGPICNPGFNAIKAAIYPEYTDYNYFLSRPDTGETVFSKMFEEHNANKRKYLK